MSVQFLPYVAGVALVAAMMSAGPSNAAGLKDEIAPSGKLRVALGISAAGGAFWSTKTESGGYAGVPVDLGREESRLPASEWWINPSSRPSAV